MEMQKVKLVIVGDSGVGKSSILDGLLEREFDSHKRPSVGVSYEERILDLDEETNVALELWDIPGADRFDSISELYINKADIVIFVFAVNCVSSFASIGKWIEKVDMDGFGKCYLLGNKCDIATRISDKQIIDLTQLNNFIYFPTSVKDGTNLDNLFKHIFMSVSYETPALYDPGSDWDLDNDDDFGTNKKKKKKKKKHCRCLPLRRSHNKL